MRDLVFIGWSENTDLAVAVKSLLDNDGFQCIIGGDYEKNPEFLRTPDTGVYSTVVKQMSKCNQAILLFNKKVNLGRSTTKKLSEEVKSDSDEIEKKISGNLLFEAGFLFSKFSNSPTKVHVFKIDITEADEKLFPSDMNGIWSGYIRSDECECPNDLSEREQKERINSFLAEKIAREFRRRQNNLHIDDKLHYLNHYRQIENEMHMHLTNPICSDYEMALHMVFYTQAIYIYQDVEYATKKCSEFLANINGHVSDELLTTVELSMRSLELFKQAVPDFEGDGHVHMLPSDLFESLEDYRYLTSKLVTKLNAAQYCTRKDGRLCSPAMNDPSTEFALEDIYFDEKIVDINEELVMWAITQAQEHVTYLFLVYFDNPEVLIEEKRELCEEAIKYGMACIHNCLILEADSKNADYIRLLLSFSYRNVSCFYSMLGNEVKQKEYAEKSSAARKTQYMQLKRRSDISPELKNYFYLEHYVQVIDDAKEMLQTHKRLSAELRHQYLPAIGKFITERTNHESTRMLVFNRLAKDYEDIIKQI